VKTYKFIAIDLFCTVGELDFDKDFDWPRLPCNLNNRSISLARAKMDTLIQYGVINGYPKPDNQERYQELYENESI